MHHVTNMIIKDKGKTTSPDFYTKEQHRDDDLVQTHEEMLQFVNDRQ